MPAKRLFTSQTMIFYHELHNYLNCHGNLHESFSLRNMNKFSQLTPEIVYWATGRTKIYPEKEFASNYRRIKSGSEKQFKSEVSLFKKTPKNIKIST